MATDKDFQELSFLLYDLTGKIQGTKSGELLLKYLNYKTTDGQTNTLFNNLGFVSKNEFNQYWWKIFKLKTIVKDKYQSIFSRIDLKTTIEAAALKVANEREFYKVAKYPTSACWTILLAQLALCQQTICNPIYNEYNPDFDYNTCITICTGAAISDSGVCFLFAD